MRGGAAETEERDVAALAVVDTVGVLKKPPDLALFVAV